MARYPDPASSTMDPMAFDPMCADARTSFPMARDPDPTPVVGSPISLDPNMIGSGSNAYDDFMPRAWRLGTDYYFSSWRGGN